MRVAHVVRSDAFAGVERYVALVAPRLAAMGWEVSVVGGHPRHMPAALGALPWRPASSTVRVGAELLRLGRLDVVHAHMTAAEWAAVTTRPRHGAQVVATRHFAAGRGSGPTAPLSRLLGRRIDVEIAISDHVAAAAGVARVVRNGVESVTARPPGARERSVLVLQRLEAEKQTSVALRAWAASPLAGRGWRLRIAGRGREEGELRRVAASLGIEGSVDWLGFVDDPGELLWRAGLLLAPSPVEGFGMTVVEAMARATPVVAADGVAQRETLGPDGWLFAPGDAAACARLLGAAVDADREAYADRLRARQRSLFDVDDHVRALHGVYTSVRR